MKIRKVLIEITGALNIVKAIVLDLYFLIMTWVVWYIREVEFSLFIYIEFRESENG